MMTESCKTYKPIYTGKEGKERKKKREVDI